MGVEQQFEVVSPGLRRIKNALDQSEGSICRIIKGFPCVGQKLQVIFRGWAKVQIIFPGFDKKNTSDIPRVRLGGMIVVPTVDYMGVMQCLNMLGQVGKLVKVQNRVVLIIKYNDL